MTEDDPTAIHVEFLAHPARKVPPAGFAGGPVACEVLDAEPERELGIRWGPQWTVTWRLVPEGTGRQPVPQPRRVRPGPATIGW